MSGRKKILIGSLIVVAVLLTMVWIAVNTPVVVKEVAKRFAPQYAISYSDISGNVFEGITIHSPRHEERLLADALTVRWNPAALLKKNISFSKVTLKDGNLTAIEKLIGSFGSDESSSESTFSFTVVTEEVDISLLPFVQSGVSVLKLLIGAESLTYAEDELDIEVLSLSLDSNITAIKLQGSYEDQALHVSSLSIKRVDLPAIQRLLATFGDTQADTQTPAEENEDAFYIPVAIQLDRVYLNAKPALFKPLHILKFDLEGTGITLNVKEKIVESGSILLDGRSNLSNVFYKAQVDDNTLVGKVALTPNKKLFELYGLPLRKEAFGDIVIDLLVTQSAIQADMQASATQILTGRKGEFNIDIESFLSKVVYSIDEQNLTSDLKAVISTPYAKDILLTNRFTMQDKMIYHGAVFSKEVYGPENNLTVILNDINVTYSGDDTNFDAKLDSDMLEGSFSMQNYQKGLVKLKTKKILKLAELQELPEELEESQAEFELNMPFDLEANQMVQGSSQIRSNIVNVDADIILNQIMQVKGKLRIPDDSLLRPLDPNVQWDKLSEIDMDFGIEGNRTSLNLRTEDLNFNTTYVMKNDMIQGILKSGPLEGAFDVNLSNAMKVDLKIDSFASLRNIITSYYTLEEVPQLEGSAALKATIDQNQKLDLSLQSPKLVYKADRESEHTLSNVDMDFTLEDTRMILHRYQLTYNKQRFFATKPSRVDLNETKIQLSPVWINDALKIAGSYDVKQGSGKINADANAMKVAHEWVDLISDINIETIAEGNRTDIQGTILLKGGKIHYEMAGRSFASDSDIIIVQKDQNKEANTFMDNLSMAVNIESQSPLSVKQAQINIEVKPSFTIYKGVNEPLMVLGTIELLEGGSYIFQEKKFTLEKSFVYFTGDVNKPLLEIKAKHQTLKHLITISVTGTPEAPNINFSSSPSLTREQILSVILFDSEAGGDTYSGEEMMKMMGGAMAKSALANVGVKLDHLVLGEGNSIEVGKKLSRDITIIYINDEIPKVELRYRHSDRFESVLGASQESSSYDIIYTRDY